MELQLEREAADNADAIAERAARAAEEAKWPARQSSEHGEQAPMQVEEASLAADDGSNSKLESLLAGGYHPDISKRRAVREALSSLAKPVSA